MLSLTRLNQKSTYGLMVKRLRRCPLTAESAVRFRMGLPKKREANTSGVGFAFFVAPERNLRGKLCLPSFVNLPQGKFLPRDSRLRETANSANDYKQKAFEIYAATCCRRSSICRKANSCRGAPACGKRQIPQMITNKKFLESTRQTRFAVVRQFATRQIPQMITIKKHLKSTRQTTFAVVRIRVSESCRGILSCGKRQIPQMITNKKYLERTRQSVSSSVSLPQSRKTFFTKEHNSSAFLWIIRLTFPKSYYIIEI